MAKDDMEIIMYKILKYLYECMKAGAKPQMEDICCDCRMFSIPQMYWQQVMGELIENGFIKGFICINTKYGAVIQATDNPHITIKGREYLRENNGMKEAGAILGKAFEIILEGIIKTLLR